MVDLKDNTIIIVPNYLKEQTLLYINSTQKLKNIKVMSLKSFIENYFFSYNEQAIYFLINKYGIKYDIASMYLNNMYFIEYKDYKSNKLNKLVKLKQELDDNNLLIYNKLFRANLKNKNLVFYNIILTKFNRKLIDELKAITKVEVKEDSYNKDYYHDIYEFNDVNSEIEFVATKICELLNDNIDIKNIVLLNASDEYINPLKRIFKIFKIPVNIFISNPLSATKMGTFFIDHLEPDIEKTILLLKEQFDLTNECNLTIYNQLINICNKYNWVDNYLKIKDLIIHDLASLNAKEPTIENAVKIVPFEEYQPNDKDYVFLIGFNQGSIPVLEKDESYITDLIKNEIDLDTTVEKNEIHSKKSFTIIKNTKNMWISYKKNSTNGPIEISTLNNILKYKIIHHKKTYNYSHLNNLITLSQKLDDYLKYGTVSQDLEYLYYNYQNNNYRSYDNAFTKIKYNHQSLTLSYSSLDNYFKCAFRYYVNSVLKINIYEETFANFVGSLFHFVLSKKDDLSLDEAWNIFLEEHPFNFSYKETFFLEKLKYDLEFILEVLNTQNNYTDFNKSKYETKVEIDKGNNVKFVGIIDKILFNEEKNLAAIIDYKTGNTNLSLNNIPYGLSLQLPIYLYLMSYQYPDIEVVGFYLQKILPTLISRDFVQTLEMQKKELLKLQGYSLANEDKLKTFDKTYIDSDLIKSMKVGNNGFYAYAKTLTSQEMKTIISLVDDKINDAIDNIKNNNFNINPKQIGKENIGCSFCHFKDICYMSNKDIVKLSEIKDLGFLGGDNNAKVDG